ncbi:hypothetical protein KM176_03020 [Pseudooceanicola sp. CBS1P-1]|uniref:histidine kinase n=1 Tax=Pseudooceanicola albus TaxID=2692189 RepID=A0A6L7G7Q0_9RHOB|nr:MULTISPECIES: histidine kinase dimerization/phospho-acceptor domain-containing protein [Pseudooceanicola]MBT9382822.1 hypothetical protein [Pseudooceanicola endophyticus]MXN20254.1 hypothetical protein [Pseudooceanicola albus]
MSRGWSLTGRLTRRLALSITGGWLAVVFIGALVIAHDMNELLNAAMKGEAKLVLELLATREDAPSLPLAQGERTRIVLGDRVLTDAPWSPLAADGYREAEGWHVLRLSQGERSIEIGQPSAMRRNEMFESARAFALLMLPFLALVLLVSWLTLTRGAAPATRFADRLAGRDARDLSRIEDTDLPRELQPIPQALNQYLARIEVLIAAERAFVGHAAHELRTPIAAARAEVQAVALESGQPEMAARLEPVLGRLAATVERLLQLARAEAGLGDDRARADLVTVLRLLVSEVGAGQVVFDDGDIEGAWVAMDGDLLGILLGNLIGNARTHGTGRVEIGLAPGPRVCIRNPVARGAAFHPGRFEKGAGSSGTGLGLSIVEAIAGQNGIVTGFDVAAGLATARLDFSAIAVSAPPVPPASGGL